MYTITFYVGADQSTKFLSYLEFVASGARSSIQNYVLDLLKEYPDGLSTRQISDISGIEVGSLTNPLFTLRKANKIVEKCRVKNRTGRVAIAYSLPNLNGND